MPRTAVAEQRIDRKQWATLAVLVLPVLLIAIDITVLSFAVPHLSAALSPTGVELLWIVDIYSFLIAGLLVTMGTLGDRIGRRRLLMLGAASFGVASLLAAFATEPLVLILARALLGAAGATLMPSTLSLIRNVFVDERPRQVAIAVWGTMFAAGNALGPLVGGWLLEHFWWGSVFLINLPLMALLLVFAPSLVPESRDPNPGRYDLLSAAMSLVAMLASVYGLKTLATEGSSVSGIVGVVLGAGVGVAFVRRQRRLPVPLLDLHLFANPPFRVSVVTNLLMTMAFVGSLFYLTQYLQLVLGMGALAAGAVLVPGLVLTIVSGLVAVNLIRRFGPSGLLFTVMTVIALGYALLTRVGAESGAAVVVLAFMVVGVGLGVIQTVTNNIVMSSVQPERAGAAAAVSETAYEVGAAMGAAVLGSVVTTVYAANLGAVEGVSAGVMERSRETLGSAASAADELSGPHADRLLSAAGSAFTTAVHVTSLVAAAVALAAAIHALIAFRAARSV